MKTKPTIHLDLRTDHGRRTFEVGLVNFTDAELAFLVKVFANADKGSSVEFGVGQTEDGRQCMQFTVGKPAFAEPTLFVGSNDAP